MTDHKNWGRHEACDNDKKHGERPWLCGEKGNRQRDGSVGTFNKAVSQVQPELIHNQKKIKILRHLFSAKLHQIVGGDQDMSLYKH